MEKILAVNDTTYAVAERKPAKNEKFRLAGIRTPTSAIPVQCSNQHVIGRNGRTFTHMNEPLRLTNQARMRQESSIIIEKTGDFGAAE